MIPLTDWEVYQYLGWLIVNVPFKLAIFYAFYYFFIPNWLGKKNKLFFITIVILVFTYPPVKYGIDTALGVGSIPIVQIDVNEDEKEGSIEEELSRRVATPIGLILIALFGRFTIDWFRSESYKKAEEQKRLEGELAMLRNQVNPHFLFNVLNNIDTMVYKASPEASDAIHRLSSIMRYMLYESDAPQVPLMREIEYLEDYIDLQKIRMKENDIVKVNLDADCQGCLVAPMLFIPFVENAFKHASTLDKSRRIELDLKIENQKIYFRCGNSYREDLTEQKDKVGGIGLSNVRRRLQLIYPGAHRLKALNKKDEYLVILELDLNQA